MQQALSNNSIENFVIVEYQGQIGGRVHNEPFGQNTDGNPIQVEYGANWAQGLGEPDGPENPIWTFVSEAVLGCSTMSPCRSPGSTAYKGCDMCTDVHPPPLQEKKWNISNHPSDFERIKTYDENGEADFESEIAAFEAAMERMAAEAGTLLEGNIQDRTVEQGLALVDWRPELRQNPKAAEAVEWWLYGEYPSLCG